MKTNKSQPKISSVRHEVLPEGFIQRVQKFKKIIKEVETSSLEVAVSNFQRDLNPENELAIWEKIASNYRLTTRKHPEYTIDDKKKLLGKLLFNQTEYKELSF